MPCTLTLAEKKEAVNAFLRTVTSKPFNDETELGNTPGGLGFSLEARMLWRDLLIIHFARNHRCALLDLSKKSVASQVKVRDLQTLVSGHLH